MVIMFERTAAAAASIANELKKFKKKNQQIEIQS